jgi:hypothetical protein
MVTTMSSSRDQVFGREVLDRRRELVQARIRVLAADLDQLLDDPSRSRAVTARQRLQLLDQRLHFGQLVQDLLPPLHRGESLQSQLEDRLCLALAQLGSTRARRALRRGFRSRGSARSGVQVVERSRSFQDVRARASAWRRSRRGAPAHDLAAESRKCWSSGISPSVCGRLHERDHVHAGLVCIESALNS